jgi:6-phosphofructokinase
LATRLGVAAVQEITAGHYGIMVGLVGNKLQITDLAQVVTCHKGVDLEFYNLANTLEFGRSNMFKFPNPDVSNLVKSGNGTVRIQDKAPEEF